MDVSATREQAKLYSRFKKGERGALHDLFDGERLALYDYLLRMTGQVARAADTVDEVIQTLAEGTADDTESYQELRLLLYSTARKFNGDVWNAETSRLENASLSDSEEERGEGSRALSEAELKAFRALDESLRRLPGPEREAVILRSVVGLDFEDVADVMGFSREAAETYHMQGMQKIDAECAVERPEETLALLPKHRPPLRSSQQTVNLSMVMNDIKTRPSGLTSPLRIAILVLLLGLLVAYLLRPDWFEALLQHVPLPSSEQ